MGRRAKQDTAAPVSAESLEAESLEAESLEAADGTGANRRRGEGPSPSDERRRPYVSVLRESDITKRLGVSVGGVSMLLPAMRLIENDFAALSRVNPTAEDVLALVGRWEAEIIPVLSAYRRHVFHSRIRDIYPMFALALVTFRYQPERAAVFWHRFWRQDGTEIDSPEREMSRFVTKMRLSGVSEDCYVRRMAEYWNAWFEARPIGRVIDHDKPARIAGTPYTGKFAAFSRNEPRSRAPLNRGVAAKNRVPSEKVVGSRKGRGRG